MKGRLGSKEIGEIITDIIEDTRPRINYGLTIRRAEYHDRWRKVQNIMKNNGYDFVYLCGSELDRSDIAYLTGFLDPIIERYGLLMPRKGVPVILAGSEGGEVAYEAAVNCGADLALLMDYQIADVAYPHAQWSTLQDVLKKAGAKPGNCLAVMSSAEAMPHTHVTMLQGAFRPENLIYRPLLFQLIKYEKTAAELRIAKYCNIISDAAFRGMLAALRPGMRELEVAGIGDFIMRLLGARRNGFPTIVTSGPRQMTVIGPATNRVIQKGDTVSMGLSASFNGYHGVVRRTVGCGGDMSANAKSLSKAVEGAYKTTWKATVQAARGSRPSNWIDQQVKQYLNKLKLKTKYGKVITPLEPYSFIHNMGCSECQEGYGAVTADTIEPLGKKAILAIDVALLGFKERGKPLFDCPYNVIEDAFWKIGTDVGIYNNLPLNCQHLVGNMDSVVKGNPYHKPLPL